MSMLDDFLEHADPLDSDDEFFDDPDDLLLEICSEKQGIKTILRGMKDVKSGKRYREINEQTIQEHLIQNAEHDFGPEDF